MRPRAATEYGKRVFDADAEPLGEDAFRLLDHDPRVERPLEVSRALICGLGHLEHPLERDSCLLDAAELEGVDGPVLTPVIHGRRSYPRRESKVNRTRY